MSSQAFKSLLRRFPELTFHSRASLGAPRLGVWELCKQRASRDYRVATHHPFCRGQERSGGSHSWLAGSQRQASWHCPALKGRDRQWQPDDFHRVKEEFLEVTSL